MAAHQTLTKPPARRAAHIVDVGIAAAVAGLAAAVALRVEIAGSAGPRSLTAGVVFAAVVAVLAALISAHAAPVRRLERAAVVRVFAYGVLGAVVLCVPAAVRHADGVIASPSGHGYLPWALAVVVVATAEEALLRGTLFTALQWRAGTAAAIGVTSLAFALVHVPLYGVAVVPLDLGVGIWLGALRAGTGSVAVPAFAHALADLAGWWLR